MATTKENTVLLDVVVSNDNSRDGDLVKVGTCYVNEKGTAMLNITSTPVVTGDWDGISYLLINSDVECMSEHFPVQETDKGNRLPALKINVLFDVHQNRNTFTRSLEVGTAWHSAPKKGSEVIRSIRVVLDLKVQGDTGDWNETLFIGNPPRVFDKKPDAAGRAPRKSSGKKVDAATTEE